MAALAVEVNDVGLVALRTGASHPLPASPGLALFDAGRAAAVKVTTVTRRKNSPGSITADCAPARMPSNPTAMP